MENHHSNDSELEHQQSTIDKQKISEQANSVKLDNRDDNTHCYEE